MLDPDLYFAPTEHRRTPRESGNRRERQPDHACVSVTVQRLEGGCLLYKLGPRPTPGSATARPVCEYQCNSVNAGEASSRDEKIFVPPLDSQYFSFEQWKV